MCRSLVMRVVGLKPMERNARLCGESTWARQGYRETQHGWSCLDLEKRLDDLIGHCHMKSLVHVQFSATGRKLSGTPCNVEMCSTFGSTNRAPAKPSASPLCNLQVDAFPCKAVSDLFMRNTQGRLEKVGWQKERMKYSCTLFLSWSLTEAFGAWSKSKQPCKLLLPAANSMGEPKCCVEVSAEFYLSSSTSSPSFTLSSWRRGWEQTGLNFQATKNPLLLKLLSFRWFCWLESSASHSYHAGAMRVLYKLYPAPRHLWLNDQWLHIATLNLYDFCPGLSLAFTKGYE